MPYVSARFAPPNDVGLLKIDERPVIATDENGVEWWLLENSQVGDWLRYIQGGGQIDPAETPPEPEEDDAA